MLYLSVNLLKLRLPPGVVDSQVRLDDAAPLFHIGVGYELKMLDSPKQIAEDVFSFGGLLGVLRIQVDENSVAVAQSLKKTAKNRENSSFGDLRLAMEHFREHELPKADKARHSKGCKLFRTFGKRRVHFFEESDERGNFLFVFTGNLFPRRPDSFRMSCLSALLGAFGCCLGAQRLILGLLRRLHLPTFDGETLLLLCKLLLGEGDASGKVAVFPFGIPESGRKALHLFLKLLQFVRFFPLSRGRRGNALILFILYRVSRGAHPDRFGKKTDRAYDVGARKFRQPDLPLRRGR